MLQLGQNSALSHITHRFFALVHVIMGMDQVLDIATRLPSANVTTMLVPKMMVSWYFFWPTLQQ